MISVPTVYHFFLGCFFFFKQKTAYELRISDWSSDVCSSDLGEAQRTTGGALTCGNQCSDFVNISVWQFSPEHRFHFIIAQRCKAQHPISLTHGRKESARCMADQQKHRSRRWLFQIFAPPIRCCTIQTVPRHKIYDPPHK